MSRLPASPYLFRPVTRAFYACMLVFLTLAALIPAPLETAANPARPPNPAKSAWFLLWIQELVSYQPAAIYAVLLLAFVLVALPWLPFKQTGRAQWFQPGQRAAWIGAVTASVFIGVLTLVALLLRGKDWCFVWPF